jgi:hypothetical protein
MIGLMGGRVALKHLCLVLCGVLLSLPAGLSRAAEWSVEPSVGLRADYDDNIHLSPAPHPGVWGLKLSPDVKFSGETETLKVTGGLNFRINRYFGEDGLDTLDHTLSLRSDYKAERDLVGLNIDSIRDSTLVSELATTGAVQARRQRSLLTANPTWSRALTEVTSLKASYSYTDVRYDDSAGTGLINYSDQSASVGIQSKLDERNVLNVGAYYDRYETRPAESRANTYGVQGGYDYDFSETLHGSFLVGLRRTQSILGSHALVCDGPIILGFCLGTVTEVTSVQKESLSGYTLNAILAKRWETDTVSGQLSREINPSGVGSLIETDRIAVTWTKEWSPTLRSNVSAAAYHSRYVGSVVTDSNSRYYTVEPRLTWRLAESWTLDAGYSYARQDYDTGPVKASANVVYVNLIYAWPKISVSR